MSEEYKARLRRRYALATVDYKRKIECLAALAERIIYQKFVLEQNTFEEQHYVKYDQYVLSTDYGSRNVSVVGLFGIKFNKEGSEYHLLDEYYYDVNDSKNNNIVLDDEELANNAIEHLLKGKFFLLTKWWIPHDGASLRSTLKNKTHMSRPIPVDSYTPDVYNDIQEIQKLFGNYKFKISKKCENSIAHAQSYAWDEKAKRLGKDEPLKTQNNDHCLDMWRAAILGSRQVKKSIVPGIG